MEGRLFHQRLVRAAEAAADNHAYWTGSREPGDLTKQMAVPWQSDFYDCTQESDLAWWPAQRPDDVFPVSEGAQVPWIRKHVKIALGMVKNWHKLGFVVKIGPKFVETERKP
jgi:hypothetical protein